MDEIIEKASNVYAKLGSDNLDQVVQKLGADIYDILHAENLKEAYFPELKSIVLRPGLPRHERRYLLAHALGHHMLHRDGAARDYLSLHENYSCGNLDLGRAEISKTESEADVFAAYLLIPWVRLNPALKQRWTKESSDPVLELALEFQVPVELMKFRLVYERCRVLSQRRDNKSTAVPP